MTKSSLDILSNTLTPPPITFIYLVKQIHHVIRLAEIVLDVVVLGRDSEFDELPLERPRLLEEAVNFSFDLHLLISCMTVILRLTVRIALWNAETSPITLHSFLARVTAVYTIGRERRFI